MPSSTAVAASTIPWRTISPWTARTCLGTETETETVEQALDLVAFRQEVIDGVRRVAGSRSLRDVFRDHTAT